jgi:homoserine dehydrogenase
VRIGICGLGNIGAEVVRQLDSQRDVLHARCGDDVVLHGVAVRNVRRSRDVDLTDVKVTGDAIALAKAESIDVLIEVIGGVDIAGDAVAAALRSRKHVITANKQLMALRGAELSALARENGVCLRFSAAVAGGIPAIEMLQSSLRGENITDILAVLNGTTTFILDQVAHGEGYDAALAQAQKRGWAEVDPSDDVEGHDSAAKLAICASVAWNADLRREHVETTGITQVTDQDIQIAPELGYRVVLLSRARRDGNTVWLSVQPTMVSTTSAMSALTNGGGLAIYGDIDDPVFVTGTAAGGKPTASAVLSDLVAVANGVSSAWDATAELSVGDAGARETGAYLRLRHKNLPEAENTIALFLEDRGVGIDVTSSAGQDTVLVVTKETSVDTISAALATLDSIGDVSVVTQMDATS